MSVKVPFPAQLQHAQHLGLPLSWPNVHVVFVKAWVLSILLFSLFL